MFRLVIILLVMLCSPGSMAHEGHKGHSSGNPYKDFDMPIELEDARKFAKDVIDKLVDKKKIDATWKDAVFKAAEQKEFKNEIEWVVTYENPRVEDSAKRTLYVFLSRYGEFLGINYTGQ